jgi:hypothetical protein
MDASNASEADGDYSCKEPLKLFDIGTGKLDNSISHR